MQKISWEKNNYVSISQKLLLDKRVSLKAKGVYALILTLPAKWDCSVRLLADLAGSSVQTIQTAIKELEKNDYLERHQILDNGRFAGMEYVVKTGYEYE